MSPNHKCGRCQFVKVCGGCRARACEIMGDYLAPEPFCIYEPKRCGIPVFHGENRYERTLVWIQDALSTFSLIVLLDHLEFGL